MTKTWVQGCDGAAFAPSPDDEHEPTTFAVLVEAVHSARERGGSVTVLNDDGGTATILAAAQITVIRSGLQAGRAPGATRLLSATRPGWERQVT